jgi:hypothetical protein
VSQVKVTLKQPHTHAGVRHPAGETIEISERQARWLAEHGVIQKSAAKATKESAQ